MRLTFGRCLFIAGCLVGSPAWSDTLVAIRPGLMCRSAAALAKLTLPDGNSKTHLEPPDPSDQQVALQGGCIDIPAGARVTVDRIFKNTAIITYQPAGGPSGDPFVVPVIDFRPEGGTPASNVSARLDLALPRPDSALPRLDPALQGGADSYRVTQRIQVGDDTDLFLEVLEDRRLTPDIQTQLWRNGRDISFVADRELAKDIGRRPLLNAKIQLASASGTILGTRKLAYPLAAIEAANLRGRARPTYYLTIDKTADRAHSGLATEILMPPEHGVYPVR